MYLIAVWFVINEAELVSSILDLLHKDDAILPSIQFLKYDSLSLFIIVELILNFNKWNITSEQSISTHVLALAKLYITKIVIYHQKYFEPNQQMKMQEFDHDFVKNLFSIRSKNYSSCLKVRRNKHKNATSEMDTSLLAFF